MTTTTETVKYPEHEKLEKIKHLSQACGEFLEWMRNEKGVILAREHAHTDECGHVSRTGFGNNCDLYEDALVPILESRQTLLAEYFSIDQKKLAAEKDQMLDEIRHVARSDV